MLTCLPQSICSWNYRILGGRAGDASLALRFNRDQGEIVYDGQRYEISKNGFLSRRWTLRNGDGEIGSAEKTIFIWHYYLQTPTCSLKLEGRAFSTAFSISVDGRNVGEVRQMHPFTRRAVIDCAGAVDELSQIFAFWFCALTWRNASQSD